METRGWFVHNLEKDLESLSMIECIKPCTSAVGIAVGYLSCAVLRVFSSL